MPLLMATVWPAQPWSSIPLGGGGGSGGGGGGDGGGGGGRGEGGGLGGRGDGLGGGGGGEGGAGGEGGEGGGEGAMGGGGGRAQRRWSAHGTHGSAGTAPLALRRKMPPSMPYGLRMKEAVVRLTAPRLACHTLTTSTPTPKSTRSSCPPCQCGVRTSIE